MLHDVPCARVVVKMQLNRKTNIGDIVVLLFFDWEGRKEGMSESHFDSCERGQINLHGQTAGNNSRVAK
jgi:hypothetical protein